MLRFLATLAIAAGAAFAAEPDKGLIVHEWGTFSTFSGSDGKALKFYPDNTDLPQFIQSRRIAVKGGYTDALVSLETPVLYFYSDIDRTVSVHVDFPKGMMTDWFPGASRPPTQQLRWDDLRILAKATPTLPGDGEKGRYFAAREVDARTVQMKGSDAKPENEKFLFYRGIGEFEMPFQMKALSERTFSMKNSGKHEVPAHFLIRVQDSKVWFRPLGKLAANEEANAELPAEASTVEKLADSVVNVLVEQGLYEKEAKAMAKTWQQDWFGEPGTRVLYLVAEPVTEELLPLKITPKPEKQVRVLVGRHDVLTPDREKKIDALVTLLDDGTDREAKAADAELNKLGRYRTAAQNVAQQRLKNARR